jgi:hypothetical protein
MSGVDRESGVHRESGKSGKSGKSDESGESGESRGHRNSDVDGKPLAAVDDRLFLVQDKETRQGLQSFCDLGITNRCATIGDAKLLLSEKGEHNLDREFARCIRAGQYDSILHDVLSRVLWSETEP